MAPKPKTTVYKDPVTAELALRAHFFTADKYLKDATLAQPAKKMFLHVQNQQACRSLLENMSRPANDLLTRIRNN